MDSKQTTWEHYTSAWKANGSSAKRSILSSCLTENTTYCDPITETRGVDGLTQYMVDFHQQIPGGHFVTTYFLAHHDTSIARWNMVDGLGNIVGEGISHGRFDNDDRLLSMTGFFETPAH